MNSWCCGQKIITLIRSHVRVDQYHQEGCSKNITSLQSLTSGNYTSLSELNQRLSMTWPSKNSIHMYFSPFTPNRDYEVLLIHYEVKRWWKERSLSTRVYCLGFFFVWCLHFAFQYGHILDHWQWSMEKEIETHALIDSQLTIASTVWLNTLVLYFCASLQINRFFFLT